jgi:hypothetical protein
MQRHIAKHFAKKLKPGQLNAAYPRPGNNYGLFLMNIEKAQRKPLSV